MTATRDVSDFSATSPEMTRLQQLQHDVSNFSDFSTTRDVSDLLIDLWLAALRWLQLRAQAAGSTRYFNDVVGCCRRRRDDDDDDDDVDPGDDDVVDVTPFSAPDVVEITFQ